MIRRTLTLVLALALLASGWAGCTHTPPGTSVEVALAKRPQVVRLPQPVVAAAAPTTALTPSAVKVAELDRTELVADAYSRGEFCMQTGKDEEAISAFREVVKIDPKFTQAWTNLALLYEKSGHDNLALEAFRKAKTQ